MRAVSWFCVWRDHGYAAGIATNGQKMHMKSCLVSPCHWAGWNTISRSFVLMLRK